MQHAGDLNIDRPTEARLSCTYLSSCKAQCRVNIVRHLLLQALSKAAWTNTFARGVPRRLIPRQCSSFVIGAFARYQRWPFASDRKCQTLLMTSFRTSIQIEISCMACESKITSRPSNTPWRHLEFLSSESLTSSFIFTTPSRSSPNAWRRFVDFILWTGK